MKGPTMLYILWWVCDAEAWTVKCVELLTEQGNMTGKLNDDRVCFELKGHKSWTS